MKKLNKNGFTLLEVLIALSILSIFVLLYPPISIDKIEKIRFQQFINVLKSDVLYTQNLSTTTESYVRLTFYSDGYKIRNGAKVLIRRTFPKGIDIDNRQGHEILFKNSGTIVNRKKIQIKLNDAVYLIVFPLGKGGFYVEER